MYFLKGFARGHKTTENYHPTLSSMELLSLFQLVVLLSRLTIELFCSVLHSYQPPF